MVDVLLGELGHLLGADAGHALERVRRGDAERGDVGELLAGVGRGEAELADAGDRAFARAHPVAEAAAVGGAEVLAHDHAHAARHRPGRLQDPALAGMGGDPLLRLRLVGDGHVGHAEAERDQAAAAGVAVGHLGELGQLDARFGEQALGDVAAQRVLLRQVEPLAGQLVDRVDAALGDQHVGLLLAAGGEQLVGMQDRRGGDVRRGDDHLVLDRAAGAHHLGHARGLGDRGAHAGRPGQRLRRRERGAQQHVARRIGRVDAEQHPHFGGRLRAGQRRRDERERDEGTNDDACFMAELPRVKPAELSTAPHTAGVANRYPPENYVTGVASARRPVLGAQPSLTGTKIFSPSRCTSSATLFGLPAITLLHLLDRLHRPAVDRQQHVAGLDPGPGRGAADVLDHQAGVELGLALLLAGQRPQRQPELAARRPSRHRRPPSRPPRRRRRAWPRSSARRGRARPSA